ncbi:hypothetical protein BISA_0576 [Bifidobacterium saguini DSM 23967]|uniref:Uncharacterized protein n=2 Tax=Bifidobacterium saguini TaxID=762210 RepID=A0A087D9I0_9BIFI|nr:hypothetical protein [Bifidobacterium saguini]KFI92180.1 hypothetical protein BISA_0576 [Bifidobacterium saguini DSM 23967]QTB90854.1 hypothetical protein BSD967_11325 [Bifidobacterium saguini]QTB90903.1 hypothetical protein BSD967_00095 [Bifidobacterium saguini]
MTETIPVWVVIVTAVIGSGATGTITAWVLERVSKRDMTITRDELDAALADSSTIRDLQSKLDRDYERLESSERDRRELRLDVLRLELFNHTRSRNQHERQLEAGKEYIDLGGNGYGHARYEALKNDYVRREAACNWTYQQ